MPFVSSVPPEVFYKALLVLGWTCIGDGKLNWLMEKGSDFFTVPKRGRVVSMAKLVEAMSLHGITPGDYLEAVHKVGWEFGRGSGTDT